MGRRALSGAGPARGQIWLADMGLDGSKRFVIVSSNARNRRLHDVLGARMTTAPKPDIPSIVRFSSGEVGRSASALVADDIVPIGREHLVRPVGALSPRQMSRVDDALKVALDLG